VKEIENEKVLALRLQRLCSVQFGLRASLRLLLQELQVL
jgi:hypothetical protein